MPVGLDSFVGVATEAGGYGVYTAPTSFVEFDSESLSRNPNYTTSMGLRAGRLTPPVQRHRQTTRDGGGSLSLKVPNKGFGKFLNLLHGNSVTPAQQAATTAYLQTHAIGLTRPDAKSVSILVNKPTVAADKRFAAVGAIVESASFSMETGAELNCELQLNARDLEIDKASVTPTYPTGIGSYLFQDVILEVDDVAVSSIVSSFNCAIPIPRKTDRWGLGTGALKALPLTNDYVRPTMSLSAEFTNATLFDKFIADQSVKVMIRFSGQLIASTYYEQIEFTFPAVKLTGSTPQVGGPDVLTLELPGEVYDSGVAAPVTVAYMSTDVTL